MYTHLSSGIEFPLWVPGSVRRHAKSIEAIVGVSFAGDSRKHAGLLLERLVVHPHMRRVWRAVTKIDPSPEHPDYVSDSIFIWAWVNGVVDFEQVRQSFKREDERICDLVRHLQGFNKKAKRTFAGSALADVDLGLDQDAIVDRLRVQVDAMKSQFADSTLAAVEVNHPSKQTAFVRSYSRALRNEAGLDVSAQPIRQIIAWISSVVFVESDSDFTPADIKKINKNR